METALEVLPVGGRGRRNRKWPDEVEARVVAETLEPGATVNEVARRHGVPANHVSSWRTLARKGRLLDRASRDRGLGKGVKKGRIWAYVRDQRPWSGAAPPGAVYAFAPDWKEEHVHRHLANTRGILQADGYKGYAKLYAPEPEGIPRLREAACWAHLRRDFHDEWDKTKSAIAREALKRIGALYDVEREITGHPAEVRLAARQKHSASKVEAFFAWSEQQLSRIPGKGDLAKAFRYGLSRRDAFSLFLSDGRVGIDNNPAERALRPIATGESLCTPSLTICKHWKRICIERATRACQRRSKSRPWRRSKTRPVVKVVRHGARASHVARAWHGALARQGQSRSDVWMGINAACGLCCWRGGSSRRSSRGC